MQHGQDRAAIATDIVSPGRLFRPTRVSQILSAAISLTWLRNAIKLYECQHMHLVEDARCKVGTSRLLTPPSLDLPECLLKGSSRVCLINVSGPGKARRIAIYWLSRAEPSSRRIIRRVRVAKETGRTSLQRLQLCMFMLP